MGHIRKQRTYNADLTMSPAVHSTTFHTLTSSLVSQHLNANVLGGPGGWLLEVAAGGGTTSGGGAGGLGFRQYAGSVTLGVRATSADTCWRYADNALNPSLATGGNTAVCVQGRG